MTLRGAAYENEIPRRGAQPRGQPPGPRPPPARCARQGTPDRRSVFAVEQLPAPNRGKTPPVVRTGVVPAETEACKSSQLWRVACADESARWGVPRRATE